MEDGALAPIPITGTGPTAVHARFAAHSPSGDHSAILRTAPAAAQGDAPIHSRAAHNRPSIVHDPGALRIDCAGDWTLETAAVLQDRMARMRIELPGVRTVDLGGVTRLDTAGAVLLDRLLQQLGDGAEIIGTRTQHARLLGLIRTAPPGPTAEPSHPPGMLERLGRAVAGHGRRALDAFAFVGELTVDSLPRLLRPRRLRGRQIAAEIHRAGVLALPITGLLAFLMGVVISYQSGTTLAAYGANIFLVDLLGITMLREMAPLLTAIIMAGRTGSAYAAQIGTMHITEEVDALRTLGITPFEILVLPKLIALLIALPLLTVWADLLGLLGGMLVASSFYSVSLGAFLERLPTAVGGVMFWTGVIKTPVFAAAITIVGCYQGFRVHGSAQAVGRATTISVVQGIFLVIVIDAIFSIAYQQLGY